MGAPHGSVERLAAGVTIGVVTSQRERSHKSFLIEAGQMSQALQCPINGRAGDQMVFSETPVTWEHPFANAALQNDSELDTPHFVFGLELVGRPKFHVVIDLTVIDWITTVEGYFKGAEVRVAARIPGAPKKQTFAAVAHMTFSGYGAPSEDMGVADAQ